MIERLHVDCFGVLKPADLGDARVANAKTMFGIRNGVAHASPDHEDMAVGEMWFYRSFPVLRTAAPFTRFAITLGNQLPSPDEARFCKKAADDLVEFLADLVDPKFRREVLVGANSNPLGYRKATRRYSVPFGNAVVMSLAVQRRRSSSDEIRVDPGATT